MDIEAERRELVRKTRRNENLAGDAWLQKYTGSTLPVLGLKTPVHREILRAFHRENRQLAMREVNQLAKALWTRAEYYEERSAAIELLNRYHRQLDDGSWRLVDSWVEEANGWALSDALAMGPISRMVSLEPSRFREILRWTRSGSIWRRRASVYALRDIVRSGELDRPLLLLKRLLRDDEFWVQRAVGTWSRECWKKNPRRIEAFLRTHSEGLPRVTITVATERSSKAFREELRRRAGWR